MSVFNSSSNGGNGGGGFSLNAGAATAATAGSSGGIAAAYGMTMLAIVLFTVMMVFATVQVQQIAVRHKRRRSGAR